MYSQIGFIGCGKMAQAMIEGLISSGKVRPSQIIANAKSVETLTKVKKKYDIFVTDDAREVTKFADVLFIAVKPNLYEEVLTNIKDYIRENTVVISIAAGITIRFMEETCQKNVKVIRTMPNTPSLVGEGMTAVCANELVNEEELTIVKAIFECFSKVEIIDESLMDAIPAISGSSPAYVYMLIEAMADGGVLQGIPRDQAYRLTAQAILGAAKMVLETGMHPGELKDNVCTPGGATIEAISTLEKNNFRAAVLAAMENCTTKSVALMNNKS
ncbi:pyrroline-5-carboxylate reductase [Lottiidibacillus patelloidae]|uniref:Pyrroline-5-carboxylate reductase n=1 Tax=Lottiidibacillus patelloidae TaxID=2670334 RepID=A0A263BSI6_9BACI|nr:pyrroline-5-carboxylate reductase [Lottiidibacillus patelloidae]OZM56680.1 pyrroline-5-carboxylate reductase [Lottiidibacillus patelloidae]